MRKTADPAAYERACQTYCQMMADGAGSKAALEATDLSHAQADLAWYESELNPNRVVRGSVKLPPRPTDGETEVWLRRVGLIVGELYAGKHEAYPDNELSWGAIGIVTDTNESFVRRAFKATGLDSRGMRKGRGGRWLDDEPRLYAGNHKRHGVQSDAPRKALSDPNYVKQADEWKPVLPVALQGLQRNLRGQAQRATKKAVAKKAVAKKTTKQS